MTYPQFEAYQERAKQHQSGVPVTAVGEPRPGSGLVTIGGWLALILVAGFKGNRWRERSLIKRGFREMSNSGWVEEETTHHSAAISGNDVRKTLEYPSGVATKNCPKCAESIKLEALVCRYCGHQFDEAEVEKIKKVLQDQASLKNKQTDLKKMNRSWRNRRTGGICLAFLGIIFFLMVCIPNVLTSNRTVNPLVAILLALLFSIPFFLPGTILLRDAKKIKGDLMRLQDEPVIGK